MSYELTDEDRENLREPAAIPWTLDDVAIIAGVLDARLERLIDMERKLNKRYPSKGAMEKVLAKIYTAYPELKP